uniref:Odorant receptor n=1 Tax=Aulacocentrum confusum TaxID=2767324 RepID=A0A7G8Z973_9HYME|nr:olfactory receptor 54 [Aulacocentrum confusum]
MKLRVDLTTALRYTQMSVFLACSWPPSKFKTNSQRFWFDLRWFIGLTVLLLLFVPLLNGAYIYRNNTVVFVKAVCMCSAIAQAIVKMSICRMKLSNLQMLHSDLDNYITKANVVERKILQVYVDRSATFHGIVTLSMWLVCLAFIIEPIILSEPFPTDVVYPFPINHSFIHITLYSQQVLALFVVASALSIDFQVALLLWFTAAKFEILGHYFEQVSNEIELVNCIKIHQKILQYANNISVTVRFIALVTIATTTVGLICGGIILISNQPMPVKLRIGNIVGNAAIELFIYSWPADQLIQTSQAMGGKVYNCQWHDKSCRMLKTIQTVIHRSQKPAIISVHGFMPYLSLTYYTSILSTTFSYFTTLRVIFLMEPTT